MVDFSRFMVGGRGSRLEPLPETVIPRLKMPVVAEPAPAPAVDPSLYSDPGLGAPIPQPAPAPAPIPQPAPVPKPAPMPYDDPAPVPQPRPQPVPQPAPQPIPAPAPPPPPPPVEVAPPPPPIPQISPEVLAQIQQQFNIPAAPIAPPPPVQVPPPVVQPEGIATLPQAPVEPPAPPVQVPPPVVQPEAPTNQGLNSEKLVNEYNSSPAAQDFGTTVSYDPSTNTFVEDVSSFGFTGDQATNTYTPDEFTDRMGYGDPQPAPEPAVTPTIDPSLYSDPELGRGVEPEVSGTRGVSPMSPTELMGSNRIAPRDGPGQVPPGQTSPRFTSGEDFMSDYNPMSSGTSMGNPTNLGTGIPAGGEPTGIETMAESVGQGDYLGIPLPDGGTFDLSTLDLSNIGGEGGMGYVDPSLYSDPNLGGGQEPEFDRGNIGFDDGPGFDPFAGVTGGLGPGGYGPEGGGFSPGDEPAFNPPQGAIDEAQGTTYTGNNFTPDLSGLDLDFSNLDLSGLGLGNLGVGGEGGAGNNSYIPEDRGGPQGGPGRGNGPGFTMGGTDASGNGNTDTGSGDTGSTDTNNPYPFIPPGTDTSGMTPETLAGLNNFYEMYPDGFDYNGLDLSGIGNIDLSGVYPGGTGTGDGSYTVDPVGPVGDLGAGDDAGSDPIDVTTPYVPPETRAASSYGLTGAVQTMPVAANPFRRPESQQGLGSLAGGG